MHTSKEIQAKNKTCKHIFIARILLCQSLPGYASYWLLQSKVLLFFLLLFLLQNVKYLLFWAKSIENFFGAARIYHHAVHILVNSGRSLPVVIVDKWMLFCWQPMAAKTFRKHSVDRSLSHWTIRSLQASGCNNETRIDKNEGIDLILLNHLRARMVLKHQLLSFHSFPVA